jgi:hypothetical protein
LRRLLGDEAGRPRFIETVPKHGYRFIAPVDTPAVRMVERDRHLGPDSLQSPLAAVIGWSIAGIVGGLAYGLAGASDSLEPGSGAISVLLVLLSVTVLVGVIGAGGSQSLELPPRPMPGPRSLLWSVTGGAAGGFLVGAFGRCAGNGCVRAARRQSPGNITGGSEGLVLGAAAGLATWLAARFGAVQRAAISAAVCGAAAG